MGNRVSVPEGQFTQVSAIGSIIAGAYAVLSLVVIFFQWMGVLRPSADRRLALQLALSALYRELTTHYAFLFGEGPSDQATADYGDPRQATHDRVVEVLGEIQSIRDEIEEFEKGGRMGRWRLAVELAAGRWWLAVGLAAEKWWLAVEKWWLIVEKWWKTSPGGRTWRRAKQLGNLAAWIWRGDELWGWVVGWVMGVL